MREERTLGLDELMIVNPGVSREEEGFQPGQFFLGEDGTLYQLKRECDVDPWRGLAGYFLGDDGSLYQVQELKHLPRSVGSGDYFLGQDGTLYQMVTEKSFSL